MKSTKTYTICRTAYRDASGRFVKAKDAKSVELTPVEQVPTRNPKRLRARLVGRVDGQTARVRGRIGAGKVTRVAVFNEGLRIGKRDPETATEARQAEKRLQRLVFAEAKKRAETNEANNFDWEREMQRERSSRGGKTSAKRRAEVKAAQERLSNEPTSALVGMLQLKGRTLAEQRAVTAEIKRRGIVAPKRRGRK